MSIWGTIAEVGGAALQGYVSGKGDGAKQSDQGKFQEQTETDVSISDFDILYNQQALRSMSDLTDSVAEWQADDRQFFESIYQPYQQAIANTNRSMLPAISTTSKATLEQNAKDLMANDTLKATFRASIRGGSPELREAATNFQAHLDTIPSEEQRVGEALASVEGQFGQLGKELTADFASRGQAVTQASKRDLASKKALAKAGLSDKAAEAARLEKTSALQAGLAARATVATTEAGIRGQDTQSLATLQQAQQAGLATPQVAGVQEISGLEGAELQAGLATARASQQFGTRQRSDVVTQTEKGVKAPSITSGAGDGNIRTAAPVPVTGGLTGGTAGGAGAVSGGLTDEEKDDQRNRLSLSNLSNRDHDPR